MATGLVRYFRTLLAGSLVLAGAVVVSVVAGSLPARPAAGTTPSAWTAYVVSYNDDAVIPVNTATDAVGSPIAVGSGPSAIAITPSATTAYVTDEGTTNTAPGFVTPIDLLTNTPGTPIPVGSGPDAIAITPNGLTAYVGNYNDDTVTPINLATNTAGTPIPVGAAPTAIAISPDGSTAYVTQGFADDDIPIDTATNKAGPSILNTSNGFASAITPDGSTLYTPNFTGNGVATLDTATDARGSIAALDDPEGIAITPDGSTAYVAYANTFGTSGHQGSLLPIDTATDSSGTPIALGTSAAEGVAITPDGSTAFVTDQLSGTVTPVDLASGTAGTPISLGTSGTNPVAIAITPDQAPVAHLTVTLAPNGSPSTFDASASTVAYGTIASYDWNFGDGTTADHDDAGHHPHLHRRELHGVGHRDQLGRDVDLAGLHRSDSESERGAPGHGHGPRVPGRRRSDRCGREPGHRVHGRAHRGDHHRIGLHGRDRGRRRRSGRDGRRLQQRQLAQRHLAGAVGRGRRHHRHDADRIECDDAGGPVHLLRRSVPPVSVTCQTSDCPIPVVQFGDTQGDSTTVSSTVSSDCNVCNYMSSESEGLPPPCTDATGCCPDGMGYQQAEISVGEYDNQDVSPIDVLTEQIVQGQAAYAEGVPYPPPPVPQTTVCAEAQALSSGSSIRAPGNGANASPAKKKFGQDLLLTKCAKPAVAPCVKKVAVSGRDVVTTVIVPVNESVTLTVGPQEETFKKVSPDSGAAGSNVTIKGTNLTEVNAVTIGGVEASIVSETAKKLVVTVPPGASTGTITLIGWSGDVTSSSAFTVT